MRRDTIIKKNGPKINKLADGEERDHCLSSKLSPKKEPTNQFKLNDSI